MPDQSATSAIPVASATTAAPASASPATAHHYDFGAINTGHNFPSPVIEWIHGKPILILNTARYAEKNFATLSHEAGYADAATTAAIQAWAPKESGVPMLSR